MRVAVSVSVAVGVIALFAATQPAADAAPEEKPFPVAKQTILREEGAVYYVDGRQKIAAGIEIAVQKDIHIKGRGNAVLEVEGELQLHGVSAREIILEGVTIELAPAFQECRIDMCIFRNGGGVRTAPEKASVGRLFIENTTFSDSAQLDIVFAGDQVDLQASSSNAPVRIRAATPEGASKNSVKLMVMNNGALNGGLVVENVADVTVRTNLLRGPNTTFQDCGVVIFDANKVESSVLEFRQSKPGNFGRTKMQKCDVYTDKIVVFAPRDPKTLERFPVDKCWFKGVTDKKQLLSTVFVDAADDPRCGVQVEIAKVMERPLELAGALNR